MIWAVYLYYIFYLSEYFGLDSCTDFDCLNGLAYVCNFYRLYKICILFTSGSFYASKWCLKHKAPVCSCWLLMWIQ